MNRSRALSGLALLAAVTASLVVVAADPASAAVTTSTSGTVVSVTVTGNETVSFSCNGGSVAVNGTVALPALACSAVTQVSLTGDGGNQRINGDMLGNGAFSADPKLVAVLGAGGDYATETPAADFIDLGADGDWVTLYSGGAANTAIGLGAGTGDLANVEATDLNDTITATSTGIAATVVTTNSSGSSTSAVTNAEDLLIRGRAGHDSISTAGVTAPSNLVRTTIEGGFGNDTVTGSVKDDTLYGDAGTNTITGGDGADQLRSASETDTVNGSSDASGDFVVDSRGLRSGGRTLSGFTTLDAYQTILDDGDAVYRARPGAGGTTLITASLHRRGQQVIPSTMGFLRPAFGGAGEVPHRVLLDAVAGSTPIVGSGSLSGNDLLDVTVPSGSWTELEGPGNTVTVTPNNPAYKPVSSSGLVDSRVHGPWTDLRQGFAHRVVRDLMFKFPTHAERDAIRDDLAAGTTTRPAVVNSLIDSDEYRGLDVDRVYVDYLDRPSDSTGRAYWITSIRNGKSLRQFRAQLFGSTEYFNLAGATNDKFVLSAYADVLGRFPDAAGQEFWVNRLDNGTERGLVARQFLASTEARRNIVQIQFLRFLDRLPTTAEASTWVTNLSSSATGEQQLIAFLANSGSYYTRS